MSLEPKANGTGNSAALRHLTHREVVTLAREWCHEYAAAFEDDPGDPEAYDIWLEQLGDRVDGDPDAPPLAFEPNREELAEAARSLLARGIAADPSSVRRFAVELWRNKIALATLLKERADGNYAPDVPGCAPVPPPSPFKGASSVAPSGPPPLPFSALLDAWAAERRPAANTLRAYRKTLRLLLDAVGVDDTRMVNREVVRNFKAARLAAGLNPGTVEDDIRGAGAVFNWAAKNDLLPANPFAGMAPRPTGRGEAPRDGYSDDDARRVLEAARKEIGWRRWLPWLLAFTGMRLNEAADLRRKDIRQEGGVWIADLVPTAARAGKSKSFQRMIPLHPALITEGFVDYVKGLPVDGPLFPDIHADATGARTKSATSAHSRWLRDVVGIKDPRKAPAHSWRHRMEDELRKVRAHMEVQDAITGHENPRNAGAGYGRGFRGMPAETLKELALIPSPIPVA